MRTYSKAFILDHYKGCTSFKLTEDMVNDNFELVVGSIDVSLTTRCNLRCKNCGSLMPLYAHPRDVELDIILKSLDRFFSCVDRIVRVNVIGGEPFLYPHLAEVVDYLNRKDQVVRVVFPTNGTVVPENERLYAVLKHPKNHVRISHYEAYDQKSSKMLDKLVENRISYSIKNFGVNEYLWYDFGGFECRDRSPEDVEKQYARCAVEWYSLYRGRLYPCPRAAHAIDLGLIESTGNYVDCLDDSISLDELKAQLQHFVYDRKYHPACLHCDRGTGKCPVVPVAEQIKD